MRRNRIRLTESDLHRIVKKSVRRILRESHEEDFMEVKRMLDGKNFFEIQNMVKNDDRFSFGSLNGSEGEGLMDLNYKGVLVTVEAVCNVLDNYEMYDEHGGFIGKN